MSSLLAIAVRNVARNRRRSLVTLAAVLVGVTAVLVLRGFTFGFVRLMVEDVVLGKTGALQVHKKGYLENQESLPLDLAMPYGGELVARMRAVPGVKGVSGRIAFSGLVSNGVAQTMFLGRGVDVATEREAVPRAGFDVAAGGRRLEPSDAAAALVGIELASSFGAHPPGQGEGGTDRLTLSSSSPQGRANSLDVAVVGLTQSSLPFENKRVLTVPLALAQELLGLDGQVTEYAVAVDDLAQLDPVAARLRATLGEGYEVHTWPELQPFVRDVIVRQQLVLGLIGLILFVIILTGIVNTMLMSVFERVREIGTMLAVGVRRRQVLRLFLLEAGVLGLLGGLAGVALGWSIVALIGRRGLEMNLLSAGHSLLRPELPWTFAAGALAVALVAALLAAAYPAVKASRLQPVDALRAV